MELEKLYADILAKVDEFKENHEKFVEKGNKSAEAKARKALMEVKKLVTPYNKASVELCRPKK